MAYKPHATFLHTHGNFLTFQDMTDKEKELIKELLNTDELEDSLKRFTEVFEKKFMAFVNEENQYVVNSASLQLYDLAVPIFNIYLKLKGVDEAMKLMKEACKSIKEDIEANEPITLSNGIWHMKG